MAIYTMTEDGRRADGSVAHVVDRDGDVLARDLDYNSARRLIATKMRAGDFYQEASPTGVYARLSWPQLLEENEKSAAFDRRH